MERSEIFGGLNMDRFFLEVSVAMMFVGGILYYRRKYRDSVIHHRDAAFVWRKMMLSVMGEIIGAHFRGSAVNNYIVRLKDEKLDIMIGDEDHMVLVDAESFNAEPNAALDEAYNRFIANIR